MILFLKLTLQFILVLTKFLLPESGLKILAVVILFLVKVFRLLFVVEIPSGVWLVQNVSVFSPSSPSPATSIEYNYVGGGLVIIFNYIKYKLILL